MAYDCTRSSDRPEPQAEAWPDGDARRVKYSLVVLTYNQEAFVREAVRAALAQDCFPIEIIISDDCSPDGTFDVIEDTVKGYDGPHHVFVRRNRKNLGLVAHINLISDLARGEVIIPAYGDDIALPSRVREIARVFDNGPALLVHSDAIAIDETGSETRSSYRKADFYRSTDPLETATSLALYLGAAGAWHRKLFSKYGPIAYPNVFDDHILGFRASLENGVTFIEKPLLKYREGVGLSYQLKRDGNLADEAATRRQKVLDMMISTFSQRLKDARTYGLPADHAIVTKLEMARRKAVLRRACYDGFARMVLGNLHQPVTALSAAAAEGLRIIRRR